MSKNKKNNRFSAQKLIDEIENLPLDELELFEEAAQGNRKDENKSMEIVTDETNVEAAGQSVEKKTIAGSIEEQTGQRAEGNALFGTPEIATNHMEKQVLEKENTLEKPGVESKKDEETIMDKKEGSEAHQKEKAMEQLTFEIKELMVENERLVASQEMSIQKHSEEVREMEVERKSAQTKIKELEEQLVALDSDQLKETIQQLEQQAAATSEAWEKEKQVYERKLTEQADSFKKRLVEHEALLSKLTQQLKEKETLFLQQGTPDSSEEVQALKEANVSLQEENEALKLENEQFQAEISEVLVFARRKANRTIQEAKIESDRMIRTTEGRIDAIHDRAKEILFEVEETKESVVGLFDALHNQVYQLSDKKLIFEALDK